MMKLEKRGIDAVMGELENLGNVNAMKYIINRINAVKEKYPKQAKEFEHMHFVDFFAQPKLFKVLGNMNKKDADFVFDFGYQSFAIVIDEI